METEISARQVTATSQKPGLCIAYRYWSKSCPVFFVESVKGKKGDWEYTDRSDRALPLSDYWQRRFAADCRAVGVVAQFAPFTHGKEF